jgi:hypothetical protein
MGQEQIGAILLASGFVCLAIAAIWMCAIAIKIVWRSGLRGFISNFLLHFKRPAWLLILGLLLAGVPYAWNAVAQRVDLGPRDKMVDGERHITLTGWDQTDYAVIRERPDAAVLQMANPDVTDETLEFVRGMNQLKELDLNDTQITDKGLTVLKELPALTSVRLKGTKITDAGFQSHLAGKETLIELDVRDTPVASKTMRSWKNAREGRKYLK